MRAARILPVLGLICWTAAWAQLSLKSPDSVKVGLSVLTQVVASTGQSIATRRYDRLPAEANELEAGLDELQKGLGDPHSELSLRVGLLTAKARVAAGALSEAYRADRASMLPLAHRQLAEAVRSIIALFPERLRPVAPSHPPRNSR